jgi:ferritin
MELKKPTKETKSVNTYKGGLPDNMYNLINSLIELEAFSSQIYLQMAAWCDPQGFTGAAKFFRKHAEEERKHMLKHYDFLADKNMLALTPMLKEPQSEYVDLLDIIDSAVEHEFQVSYTYEKSGEQALLEPCHQTYQHLQWYIHEQVEEESLYQTIKDKANILMKGGMTGLALFELDEMLGDLAE